MPTLRPRYNTLPVDDTDSRFQYSGSWSEVEGSTRQWDSGVKLTQQTGAKVSFSFVGSDAFLYHTIPSGTGNVVVDISIDGGSPVRVTKACGGAQPVYDDIFYKTPIMADGVKHTIVITNQSPSNIPFMFDKVDLHAQNFATMLAPAPTAAKPTSAPAPPATTTPPPSSAASSSTTLSGTPVTATQSSTQNTELSSLPVSITGSNSNSASASGSLTVSSPQHSGLTSAASQSSTTFVTTNAQGFTVTQTKALGGISGSSLPGAIQTGTGANGNVGAASKAPTAVVAILGIVFGVCAILFLVLTAIICISRRRKARERAQSSYSPERQLIERAPNLAPNPFRLEPAPSHAVSDYANGSEYAIGGSAVYRDEKRPDGGNPSTMTLMLNTSVDSMYQSAEAESSYAHMSRSGDLLTRESVVGSPNPPNGGFHYSTMSRITERPESTAYDSAPPAYHDNSRSSIVTSFYQQSTR